MSIEKIKTSIAWFFGIAATVLWYVLAEGWLILVVKIFGFWGGTVIVMLVTFILSCLVIYISSGARNVGRFRDWIKEKEAGLSKKAQSVMQGGKVLVIANTAIFLGPMVSAIFMLMLGIDKKKVYIYSIPCSLLCAVVWSGFYSGIFWGMHRIVAWK